MPSVGCGSGGALLRRVALGVGCEGVLNVAIDFLLLRAVAARAGVAVGTGRDDLRGVLAEIEIFGTVDGAGMGGMEDWPGVVMFRRDVLRERRPGV